MNLSRLTHPSTGPNRIVGFFRSLPLVLIGIAFSLCGSTTFARTIVITDEECELMAAITAAAPRVGWAGISYGPGEYINSQIDVTTKSSFLIQFPLDRIPKSHRIRKAELTIPYDLHAPPTGIRTQVHRLLADWGPGVCHQFRRTRPERVEWKTAGAMGFGTDRAVKPTATASLKGAGEHTFNVTEDVELWHSGAAGNHGWLITTDDPMGYLRLASPFWGGAKSWKLRITFEPR
ncbi:MAG: DNRLRE domain-containing protein [Planctomycetota bacterium]|nr:DNRLRE domain-containing protein [Planctomycetota bacterium]